MKLESMKLEGEETRGPGDEEDSRVFIIQPRSRSRGDEKLRSIRLGTSVRHTECIRSIMSKGRRKFVLKVAAPEGFTSCTVSERVSSLQHLCEWNDVKRPRWMSKRWGKAGEVRRLTNFGMTRWKMTSS